MTSIDPIRECFDRLADDVLLTPGHAAEVLAVSAKTLEDWRPKGIKPPAWLKLGDPLAKTSPVRYRIGDLRTMLRGSADTLATSAATAARQAIIDGTDEPLLRPGRQLSRHASVAAFLATGTTSETWPFILAELDGRPLDAADTMGSDIDGTMEWLTLADYADAWRDAVGHSRAREDRAELAAVATPDIHSPAPAHDI